MVDVSRMGFSMPRVRIEFRLTMPGQFTAINMGNRRNIRCPHRKTRSWMKTLKRV